MPARLKPCPFCGGEAELERPGDARQSCIVACTMCGCRLECGDEGARSGSTWNDRHENGDLAEFANRMSQILFGYREASEAEMLEKARELAGLGNAAAAAKNLKRIRKAIDRFKEDMDRLIPD